MKYNRKVNDFLKMENGRVKIENTFKKQIYNATPQSYKTHMGIGPYFIPIFNIMYWKRLEVALELSRKYFNHQKLRICDFGCGLGVLVNLLSNIYPESQICGIDIYPDELLKVAANISDQVSQDKNYVFSQNNIENPSSIEKFDLIFCLDVLEHVNNVYLALNNLKSFLNEESILILAVPVENWYLKLLREIYTLNGRFGTNDPHWNGDIKDYRHFEKMLKANYKILESSYVPNRFLAYDKIFVCKNRG